ncbi:MAG: citrate synthase [Chthonomonadaceae bacterium]|nr:citrate synthase [Chthonomonadaceae bacterium]
MTSQAGGGLRGVVIGESRISDVQPEGKLYYQGYSINELADHSTFEEVVFLLWNGKLPSHTELAAFETQLRSEYAIPEGLVGILRGIPKNANSMHALSVGVSALATFDPEAGNNAPEANLRKATRLQAKIPTVVAAIERLSQGMEPVAPRTDLGIAANFLFMLTGTEPDPLYVKTMDIDFILHADHELNASTFATRVTVATGADLYCGCVSGIGALSGPRHGGAAEETMEMLLEIGSIENVDGYVRPRLTGEKRQPIPGFGHPVYRAPDPRSARLREMSRQLGELKGETKWYDMTVAIEGIVDELSNTPERLAAGKQGIYPNVDCFSASCYTLMDLPVRLFTPMFAVSRTSGWCAHMFEQMKPGEKIIRPRAEYIGEHDLPYIPVEKR